MKSLKELAELSNIAEELDTATLQNIGNRILNTYKVDLDSMEEWLADVRKVEELSTLASKKKSYPLPNSANIKFPIITKACYEYSSRVYPEIIRDGKIVKANVIGYDYTGKKELKARKVADYMNWQLYWQNDDWELELDRLLNRVALIGFICKKTYFDPIRGIVRSILCEPEDLIINACVKTLDDDPRITHVVRVKLNDLIEGSRAGIYCEDVVEKLTVRYKSDELNPDIVLLEQHTKYDLDEDSYGEPYIITVLKETGEVLRIVSRYNSTGIKEKNKKIIRIEPLQHFTDYHFLVSPKGKFQSVGFGILLLHLNETINTILNQLVDAGQLANLQGGYKDSRLKHLKSGMNRVDPGEFQDIKVIAGVSLKDGILPINYKEPSSVLYQLLGLLIDAAKELSASTDLMSGNANLSNTKTGAAQALLSEGIKVHNAINKRIYRSLGQEIYKIFILDGIYLDPEEASTVLDEEITLDDFDPTTVDIIPVADPNLASVAKQASEIQTLSALQTMPGIDPIKVTERIVKKLTIDKPEELLIDQSQPQPPNPEVIKIQAEIQNMAEQNKLKAAELDLKRQELQSKIYETQCKCLELKAKATLEFAQAESLEKGQQLQAYLKELDLFSQKMNLDQQSEQRLHDYTSQQSDQAHQQQMLQQEQNFQKEQNQIPPEDLNE